MIPHNRPSLGEEEKSAASRVLSSGWVAQGPEVASFENDFCEFLGLPEGHAVAVSSGTAALFLALWICGVKQRKILQPAYACAALRNATVLNNATPLFVDTSPGTPNVDVTTLSESRAFVSIAVHTFGIPIDLRSAKGLVIEDCAQALGASVAGMPVGLHGKIGIFSFYATKIITTGGQGGMLVSNDKSVVDAVRDYREFDCRSDQQQRFNFQMTDLQAAIGRIQLRSLPQFIERREEIFRKYAEAGIPLIEQPDRYDTQPVRYRVVVKTSNPDSLVNHLRAEGVHAIIPLESWELQGNAESCPNARDFIKCTVSIPIFPSLNDDEVEHITAVTLKHFE